MNRTQAIESLRGMLDKTENTNVIIHMYSKRNNRGKSFSNVNFSRSFVTSFGGKQIQIRRNVINLENLRKDLSQMEEQEQKHRPAIDRRIHQLSKSLSCLIDENCDNCVSTKTKKKQPQIRSLISPSA